MLLYFIVPRPSARFSRAGSLCLGGGVASALVVSYSFGWAFKFTWSFMELGLRFTSMQFCQFRKTPGACNGSPMAGWPERCSRCLGVLLRSVLLLLLLLRLLLWRLTASSLDPRASSLDSIGTRRNSSVLFELADLRATGARRRSSYESFRAVRFSFERFRIVSTSFEGCRVFVASLFVRVAKSSAQFRIVPKGFS